MGNYFKGRTGNIIVREANGYAGRPYYNGSIENVLCDFLETKDTVDLSDEDRYLYIKPVVKGKITLRGAAAEKFKGSPGIFDIKVGQVRYTFPAAQRKQVREGTVAFSF